MQGNKTKQFEKLHVIKIKMFSNKLTFSKEKVVFQKLKLKRNNK